ncbi:MAG: hypothetical protein WA110_05630 [Anaerolineaceae bacterium]
MKNRIVHEFNEKGCLLYSESFIGTYTRGASLENALKKFPDEIRRYCLWANLVPPADGIEHLIIQTWESGLKIEDADTEVIFNSEKQPLMRKEYDYLKSLVMKSAQDFQTLFESIPDKNKTTLPERKTFYGDVPRTAHEMHEHANGVAHYYFGEIGVEIENQDDIVVARQHGFDKLEEQADFLLSSTTKGSYDEYWSLRKVLRRFIWHDRIHAKAMSRMAIKTWSDAEIEDPFCFGK